MSSGSTFVLDCSVTLSWLFVDEQDAYALSVLRSLTQARAVVPAIWPLEVANGLLMAERRQRSTEADTTAWLQTLASLPIEVEEAPAALTFSQVVSLARGHQLTSYDAAYLELALRRKLPMATMETKLREVAQRIGLTTYRPRLGKRRT